MSARDNRRIFWNRNTYYFRYRTKGKTVFKTLSPDIRKARIMRDKLEDQLGLSK